MISEKVRNFFQSYINIDEGPEQERYQLVSELGFLIDDQIPDFYANLPLKELRALVNAANSQECSNWQEDGDKFYNFLYFIYWISNNFIPPLDVANGVERDYGIKKDKYGNFSNFYKQNYINCTRLHEKSSEYLLLLFSKTIVKYGKKLNYDFYSNSSIMDIAIHRGELALVKLLFTQTPLGAKDTVERNWFAAACRFGHSSIVEFFLSKKIPQGFLGDEQAYIFVAARENRIEVVKLLLEQENIDNFWFNGRGHLAQIISDASEETIKLLLADERIGYSLKAFHNACMLGLNDVVATFLNKKIPFSPKEYTEALEKASTNGHVSIVEQLLKKINPDDINAIDNYGYSLLDKVAVRGHVTVVKLLQNHGAVFASKNLLESVCHEGHVEILKLVIENEKKSWDCYLKTCAIAKELRNALRNQNFHKWYNCSKNVANEVLKILEQPIEINILEKIIQEVNKKGWSFKNEKHHAAIADIISSLIHKIDHVDFLLQIADLIGIGQGHRSGVDPTLSKLRYRKLYEIGHFNRYGYRETNDSERIGNQLLWQAHSLLNRRGCNKEDYPKYKRLFNREVYCNTKRKIENEPYVGLSFLKKFEIKEPRENRMQLI